MLPSAISIIRATATRILSAMGSSMRPKSDPAFNLRAAKPSRASLAPAIQKITKAAIRAGAPGTANKTANTGTNRIRETVMRLGKVSMGPTLTPAFTYWDGRNRKSFSPKRGLRHGPPQGRQGWLRRRLWRSRNAAGVPVSARHPHHRSHPADWRREPSTAVCDGRRWRNGAPHLAIAAGNREWGFSDRAGMAPGWAYKSVHAQHPGLALWRSQSPQRLQRPDRQRPGMRSPVGPARRRS